MSTSRSTLRSAAVVHRDLALHRGWIIVIGGLSLLISGGALPTTAYAAGLPVTAHAQFESIHPFLDGNGRIGRMLIALLVEHWGLLDTPLLYVSLPLKRRQADYYDRLTAIRTDGDWEGWLTFFLECLTAAADDGVRVARAIHALLDTDRRRLAAHDRATVAAFRLLDHLPANPMVTVPRASRLLGTTAPPARKAIELLEQLGVLGETTGKQRDRVYAYHAYLDLLTDPATPGGAHAADN